MDGQTVPSIPNLKGKMLGNFYKPLNFATNKADLNSFIKLNNNDLYLTRVQVFEKNEFKKKLNIRDLIIVIQKNMCVV